MISLPLLLPLLLTVDICIIFAEAGGFVEFVDSSSSLSSSSLSSTTDNVEVDVSQCDSSNTLLHEYVYFQFDDGWHVGQITDFGKDTWIVTWDDGEKDEYHYMSEELAEMLYLAEEKCTTDGSNKIQCKPYDNYDVGTAVYFQFQDGWLSGNITRFESGKYTIVWDINGKPVASEYKEGYEYLEDMVENAYVCSQSRNNYCGSQNHKIGTAVQDEHGRQGLISDYYAGSYTISWEEDEYQHGSSQLDSMILKATASDEEDSENDSNSNESNDNIQEIINKSASKQMYSIGTAVYDDEDSYAGIITNYDSTKGVYTVTWDASNETISNIVEDYKVHDRDLAEMVEAAVEAAEDCGSQKEDEHYFGVEI